MTTLSGPTPMTDAAVRETSAFENIEGLGPLRRCSENLERSLAEAVGLLKEARQDLLENPGYEGVVDVIDAFLARIKAAGSSNLFLNCGNCGLDQGWAHDVCPRCGRRP